MDKPSDISLPDADWQQTPESVQAVVSALWSRVQQLEETVATSRNSSRPPSSDGADVVKPSPRRSGRKPGGQAGHPGQGRRLVPLEQVDEVVAVKPTHCSHCSGILSGVDPHPQRHQVSEIPPVQAQVTEYQLHTLCCPQCQLLTPAPWPTGVPTRAFGPRVQALVSLLSGAYRLSKRQIQTLLSDGFGVKMALGTVSPLEQATSQALVEPVDAAHRYIQHQAATNADETSWREGQRKAWLWTVVTSWVSVFVIRFSRGSQVVHELLDDSFEGVVGSDRRSAYSYLPLGQRQLCWAHLKRDFQAFVDRGGESAQVGEVLLELTDQMFGWWYRVRDGTLKRSSFQTYMADLKLRMHLYLWIGQEGPHAKTAATCREVLKVEKALWTFVSKEGVEPTNNAAERALRPAVLWRKSSFGTHSEAGSRFVERIMTVVATLRQQNRPVLDYLIQAAQAQLEGHTPPSLLPDKKRCVALK